MIPPRQRLAAMLGAAIGLLAIGGGANAGTISTYTSRSTFPGNDLLGWGQLGSPSSLISAPFSATSLGGLTINVTQPGNAPFEREDEGNGWNGIFAPGEQLLSNANETGEMQFSHAPVAGFGTAIQADSFGSYTATLSTYDGTTFLGAIVVVGNNTGENNATAPFAGITDSAAEITSITIGVNAGGFDNNGFAIDSLSLLTAAAPGPAPVPEPASLMLLGGALLGLSEIRRRRRGTPFQVSNPEWA